MSSVISLQEAIQSGTYDGYAYSYPHKTAYRPLDPPILLSEAWETEDKSKLFFYLHLPFCEMRCGFCNLFTTIRPNPDFVETTLRAIERQIEIVANEIEPVRVVQAAIGGGTPSYLSEEQLERLFTIQAKHWPIDFGVTPLSLEVSPATVSPEKLRLLKQLGVTRLSIGIQSFVEEDLKTFRRPLLGADIEQVCSWIKSTGFEVWNLDLIYGAEGQDEKRWAKSLKAAIRWSPEEIYLYPLYIGKLTNLDLLDRQPGQHRRALYEQARIALTDAGYEQVSMRLFRRLGVEQTGDYCCQQDGMVGLGPGARSYTRDLHYSTDYAVGQKGVRSIIAAYQELDYRQINYGVHLSQTEQQRRFLIKSLLRKDGLRKGDFRSHFGQTVERSFPELHELYDLGLARNSENLIQLTADGLALTDTIGPWLYSPAVKDSMRAFAFR